jgi:hypothetical protein
MANLKRPNGVDIDPQRGSLDGVGARRKLRVRNEAIKSHNVSEAETKNFGNGV